MQKESFSQWCLVELFGHQRIAGLVTEETIGGCSFIRVDVPAVDGSEALTKFYGNGAIYSMTPISEELALLITQRNKPAPISVYIPEIRQIAEKTREEDPEKDSPF